MQVHDRLERMDAQQLRAFAAELLATVASKDQELRHKHLKIEKLTHEMAVLKRWKFAARSEQLHGTQRKLFDEAIDADLEAIAAELALSPKTVEVYRARVMKKMRAPSVAALVRLVLLGSPENGS